MTKAMDQGRKHTAAFENAAQPSSARGIDYEAEEGARGAGAAREENCQLVDNSGGETPHFVTRTTCCGKDFRSAKSINQTKSSAGAGTVADLFSSILYAADASAQHGAISDDWLSQQPSFLVSQPAFSIKHNDVAGSQSASNHTAMIVLKWLTKTEIQRARRNCTKNLIFSLALGNIADKLIA
jgi:hypothetical protein